MFRFKTKKEEVGCSPFQSPPRQNDRRRQIIPRPPRPTCHTVSLLPAGITDLDLWLVSAPTSRSSRLPCTQLQRLAVAAAARLRHRAVHCGDEQPQPAGLHLLRSGCSVRGRGIPEPGDNAAAAVPRAYTVFISVHRRLQSLSRHRRSLFSPRAHKRSTVKLLWRRSSISPKIASGTRFIIQECKYPKLFTLVQHLFMFITVGLDIDI